MCDQIEYILAYINNVWYPNNIKQARYTVAHITLIVHQFLQYNQQDTPVSHIIYSCKTLYMFRTVFPPIIRSSKLLIQQRYMSKCCCYLLLAAGSSSCLTYTVAVYAVLSS
jgi:hypothetical protein